VAEPAGARVPLAGVPFDPLREADVVSLVTAALRERRGGRIVTPNVDILRLAGRDPQIAALVAGADVVVADGMPLLWAARLAGRPLPARVPGSDLIWSLSAAAARHGFRVYLLGGEPGVPQRAAGVLRERYPRLRVAGTDSPPLGFERSEAGYAEVLARAVDAEPDIVFVGLGFPKQERLAVRLAPRLPGAWFLGCGAAIPFVAGTLRRAPVWMQRSGLEWAHRLGSEPGRLFGRYVLRDGPFAVRLLARAVADRRR
jgi:N-acetylglucosaminyldiphosphoundecaprenol N-acetyl-beta-D-mannosaminyltransferase